MRPVCNQSGYATDRKATAGSRPAMRPLKPGFQSEAFGTEPSRRWCAHRCRCGRSSGLYTPVDPVAYVTKRLNLLGKAPVAEVIDANVEQVGVPGCDAAELHARKLFRCLDHRSEIRAAPEHDSSPLRPSKGRRELMAKDGVASCAHEIRIRNLEIALPALTKCET
jgi:hypothetical protein